jgi:hypothetical protein
MHCAADSVTGSKHLPDVGLQDLTRLGTKLDLLMGADREAFWLDQDEYQAS